MGLFTTGTDATNKVRKMLQRQYLENKQGLTDAGAFAEQGLSPYMLDPSVMQEFQGAITGDNFSYRKSPVFQRYMDVGREAMMEDMAGTGTLYSGKRMEGMRDLGQSAFGAYMNTMQSLAGFGRDTAAQMGGIRMNTAANIANSGSQTTDSIANLMMAQQANNTNLGVGIFTGMSNMAKSAMGGA